MKVSELIEILKNQPPENEVYVSRFDQGDAEDIVEVKEDDVCGVEAPGVLTKATFIWLDNE